MNRKEFFEALTGGATIAGLPPVKSAEVLRVTKDDIVVIKTQRRVTDEQLARLKAMAESYYPDIRWMVIDGEALDIEVIRKED